MLEPKSAQLIMTSFLLNGVLFFNTVTNKLCYPFYWEYSLQNWILYSLVFEYTTEQSIIRQRCCYTKILFCWMSKGLRSILGLSFTKDSNFPSVWTWIEGRGKSLPLSNICKKKKKKLSRFLNWNEAEIISLAWPKIDGQQGLKTCRTPHCTVASRRDEITFSFSLPLRKVKLLRKYPFRRIKVVASFIKMKIYFIYAILKIDS